MAALPCASATLHWRQFAFKPIDKMAYDNDNDNWPLRVTSILKKQVMPAKTPRHWGWQSLKLNSFNLIHQEEYSGSDSPPLSEGPAPSDLTSPVPPPAPSSAVAAPHQRPAAGSAQLPRPPCSYPSFCSSDRQKFNTHPAESSPLVSEGAGCCQSSLIIHFK